MSPARIAAAAVAGALGLTAAPALLGERGPAFPADAGAGVSRAQAADCVPVQHSKRVVKRTKVRRHGKLVTVKRKKTVRWTTCEPLPPPPPVTCAEPSSDLGVTARDSSGSTFSLSRPCVNAGLVGVHFLNLGEDPHNLFLSPAGPGSEPVYGLPEDAPFELPPGPMSEVDGTFELTGGEWYLWCDLLTHEQQGMYATLQVR